MTEILRVERVFPAAVGVIRRRWASYLAATLAFGVAPSLLISALFALPPGHFGGASVGARLVSMIAFLLGDAALRGVLARVTLDDLAGRRSPPGQALAETGRRYGVLLVLTVLLDTPVLALNLFSGLIDGGDPAIMLGLYAVRFAIGVTLGALWCGAAVAAVEEGLGVRASLARAADITRGQRPRVALFFAAFFILKVLGPYLLVDWTLARLLDDEALVALIGLLVWNLLACSLAVAVPLLHVELRRLRPAPASPIGLAISPG